MHHWYIYGGLWHRHSRRFPSKKSGWTGWGNLTYYCGVYPDSRHIPYRLYSLLLLPIQRKKPFHVWHLNCCLINIFIFTCYKLNAPNGYKLLGCIGVSHNTTNNVAINAVANNGKLRVFNNTSKILNNIIFTGTWLLYKISK